jgi:cytochrome P450
VASSAAGVGAVLEHPDCRVRPLHEPVPTALAGTPLGDWFGQLVRMNDGTTHQRLKPAVSGALAGPSVAGLADAATRCAERLLDEAPVHADPAALDRFIVRLPADSIANLLGVPDAALPVHASHLAALGRALAPQASADERQQGNVAIVALTQQFRTLQASAPPGGLLAGLQQRLGDHALANAIGCCWQAFDAGAALVGNALGALAEHPAWQARLAVEPVLWRAFLREVLRFDAPIQNTRRFVAADGLIAGQALKAGDAILLLLGAANRDPALNPRPEAFDPLRAEPRYFSFSHGAHACPGEPLALAIAEAGLTELRRAGLDPSHPTAYRPSPNARLPLFTTQGVHA